MNSLTKEINSIIDHYNNHYEQLKYGWSDIEKLLELKQNYIYDNVNAEFQRELDKFIDNQNVKIIHGLAPWHPEGDSATYHKRRHEISINKKDKYINNIKGYYHDLFHELAHSTMLYCGRETLARYSYTAEEMIAELSALSLERHFGILSPRILYNGCCYIKYAIERKLSEEDSVQVIKAVQVLLTRG